LFFGVRHDLAHFKNDHTKSKVLGHMTAQHLILISTSDYCVQLAYKRTFTIRCRFDAYPKHSLIQHLNMGSQLLLCIS